MTTPSTVVQRTQSSSTATRTVRVLFAGGGTGGHVCPALAVAEALETLAEKHNADADVAINVEVLFLGTDRDVETKLISAAQRNHAVVAPTRIRRSLKTLPKLAFATAKGMAKALSVVGQFKPDVALGLGGYGSFPGLLAARVFGAPYVLFEPNAVPGRANRLAARGAEAIFTQYKVLETVLAGATPIKDLGVPIRSAAKTSLNTSEAKQKLGLTPTQKCLLIVGGSQGAKALNDWGRESLATSNPDFSVIHVAGSTSEAESLEKLYKDKNISANVIAFADNMADLYAAADLVLSRAGGATIAEVTAAGKPSILIPYPHAVDDHQRANANALGDAAIVIEQTELNNTVFDEIAELFETDTTPESRLAKLSNAAQTIGKPDAAESYAAALLAIVDKNILRKRSQRII